jgi:hypothetical protein
MYFNSLWDLFEPCSRTRKSKGVRRLRDNGSKNRAHAAQGLDVMNANRNYSGRPQGLGILNNGGSDTNDRRAAAAGIKTKFGNHTCCPSGITLHLKYTDQIKIPVALANRSSNRRTQLRHRRSKRAFA